ncbi:hypothetical protein MPL3365_50092 [Mesorhizobium plurifarium]|uniref:Uncharacterized protein n=1 Tax=Mesorhizobium plurifarium TaxID=69974 RepID=A0A090GVR6_MESPL|nr:hypothetical protein MPL3365_50092 [Mesorhizobium plurifarium]
MPAPLCDITRYDTCDVVRTPDFGVVICAFERAAAHGLQEASDELAEI